MPRYIATIHKFRSSMFCSDKCTPTPSSITDSHILGNLDRKQPFFGTSVPAIFVPVKLTTEDGVVVDSTITDFSGCFEFIHMIPNETYMLHFGTLLCVCVEGVPVCTCIP